jgi:hypothetical protein
MIRGLSENSNAGTGRKINRKPGPARPLFPLPGEEGQGEGECHNQFPGIFKTLFLAPASLIAAPLTDKIAHRHRLTQKL